MEHGRDGGKEKFVNPAAAATAAACCCAAADRKRKESRAEEAIVVCEKEEKPVGATARGFASREFFNENLIHFYSVSQH